MPYASDNFRDLFIFKNQLYLQNEKHKFLSKLMFATLVMAASLGFTACGGDDDNNGDEPQALGVWTTVYKVECGPQ